MNQTSEFSPFRPMALDSRHLRLILTIVDEGGLTRASERLNVTQSALSHQLKQIENSLGLQLFMRVRKRLVLTEAGRELVDGARQIVTDIASLEENLRRRATGWRGSLRISTECYTAYEWLPPLLKRFRRKHPNIDVNIVPRATDNPVNALLNGEIDLAIITDVHAASGLSVHSLFRDELLLLVPPGHRLASKEFARPSDLESERMILYTPKAENFFYRQFFARSAKSPEVTVVKLTEAILSMVRAGLGIGVGARWAISEELTSGRLVGVRLGAEGFQRDWLAATVDRRGRPEPAYVTDFVNLIAEAAIPSRFAARAV